MGSRFFAERVSTRSVPLPRTETTDRPLPAPEPLYQVVLLDDEEHTYDYVIRMLCTLFGHTVQEAFAMAREVDTTGRVVVSTTHRERAELKREQIETFGPDPLIVYSRGSMRALIEPIA